MCERYHIETSQEGYTMWKKVEKYSGVTGKAARISFAVDRQRSGHQGASLIVPFDKVAADRANIYSDGNGKLAFHMCESGEFAVFKASATAKTRKITIPTVHAKRIPFGVTDVNLSREGDMWVLDLSQLSA